jgi:hypothetical protein
LQAWQYQLDGYLLAVFAIRTYCQKNGGHATLSDAPL